MNLSPPLIKFVCFQEEIIAKIVTKMIQCRNKNKNV